MARNTKNTQSRISFGPTKQRRERLNAEKSVHAKELNAVPVEKVCTTSPLDEILNGKEPQQLLKEYYSRDTMQTPRFHQESMTVADKLLNFFDTLTEYGPAQGMSRLQRWERAERLGKHPPKYIKRMLEASKGCRNYEYSFFDTEM